MFQRAIVLLVWLSVFTTTLAIATPSDEAPREALERSLAPRLWIPDGDPAIDQLPLTSSHAEIRIDGPIAQVRVIQRYANSGERPINARYIFPGSSRAAVQGLSMRIGERRVRARIHEKQEAAQIFAEAAERGQRAALLEQQRPNVFSMEVANILPGDELELILDYSELLVPEQGVYELLYPTVVGPRYGGDPLADTDAASSEQTWISNPYALNDAEGSNPAAIDTDINLTLSAPLPIRDLRVVQHQVLTQWNHERSVSVTLDPTDTNPGNRDYVLRFRLQGEQILSGLMTFTEEDEQYFLAMAEPPERVTPRQILPREFLFVVDVSGSMNGFPLQTAGVVMGRLLGDLRPEETFNILFFAGGSDALSPEPLAATPENIRQAILTMQSYSGGGGTELGAALEDAFAMPKTADIARSLVVLTDGYISAEREVYDQIRAHLNDSNLFAFGVGSSVNRFLIESMAHAGAGEPFVVTDANEVEAVSARFRRYVDAPLLSEIRLQGQDVELYDLEPAEIPIMLAERPIVVLGKLRAVGPEARLELTGRSAAGDYRHSWSLSEAEHNDQARLLPVLWARQRLVRLSDFAGHAVEDNREEILSLGLNYSLLTRYTSFVAVDELIANPGGGARTVRQPLPSPLGVSTLSLASPMPEPELLWLVVVLILIGLVQMLRTRRIVP